MLKNVLNIQRCSIVCKSGDIEKMILILDLNQNKIQNIPISRIFNEKEKVKISWTLTSTKPEILNLI